MRKQEAFYYHMKITFYTKGIQKQLLILCVLPHGYTFKTHTPYNHAYAVNAVKLPKIILFCFVFGDAYHKLESTRLINKCCNNTLLSRIPQSAISTHIHDIINAHINI